MIAAREGKTTTRERPSAAVQKKLVSAVLRIFSRGDFHQANMRDIAKDAKVSFRTIYKYYGSKEALLFSFVDDWLAQQTTEIVRHLRRADDIRERLRECFRFMLEWYQRNPDIGKIVLMTVPLKTWMADETYAQRSMMRVFLETLREGQNSGHLNPDVPTRYLLDFILGTVARSFTMWVYRGQREDLATQADLIFGLLWGALANPATKA